jgi:hypothetical protein
MAKCPQCSTRKGKRYCPALATEICSLCCAEHRLQTIACPQDCPHLASEFYQQGRRRDRAASEGRRFADALNEMFEDGDRRQLAFILQADVFYFARQNGDVTNAVVLEAFQHVEGLMGTIVTSGSPPHLLAAFLAERIERGVPHTELRSRLNDEEVLRVVRAITRHVNHLGVSDGTEYLTEIRAFFSALDFVADLDYDPSEGQTDDAPDEPKRSSGGLILP